MFSVYYEQLRLGSNLEQQGVGDINVLPLNVYRVIPTCCFIECTVCVRHPCIDMSIEDTPRRK